MGTPKITKTKIPQDAIACTLLDSYGLVQLRHRPDLTNKRMLTGTVEELVSIKTLTQIS